MAVAPNPRFVECTDATHGAAVREIFNEAIANTTALYDYEPRSAEVIAAWFEGKHKQGLPVIGAVGSGDELLGFASYGAFRPWAGYRYTIEHSVYVHGDHRGKRIGLALMRELIARARAERYHVMVGVIDMANTASIALHERLGFFHSGTIEQAGFKFGRWLDVGFYQLVLGRED
jgi:L-amino acid N-acyltransferase